MTAVPALHFLVQETPYRWRMDPVGAMRVPGIVFATRRRVTPRLRCPSASGMA